MAKNAVSKLVEQQEKLDLDEKASKVPMAVFRCRDCPEAPDMIFRGKDYAPTELRCMRCGAKILPKLVF